MGYIMAKSWMLPEGVIEVILHHHHADIDILERRSGKKIAFNPACFRIRSCFPGTYLLTTREGRPRVGFAP